MRRFIAAVVVSLSIVPQLVAGQSIAPGTRVRVTHPGEGTRTGQVISLTPDTIEVRLDGRSEPAHLPLDQVARLEVSGGMQRPFLRRAGIGFLVGGAVGAAGLASASGNCSTNEICFNAGDAALVGGIFFGAIGGVLGLASGVVPSEKWERVVVQPRRISFDARPAGRGAKVGLSLAF
jgi:hypothetical protein